MEGTTQISYAVLRVGAAASCNPGGSRTRPHPTLSVRPVRHVIQVSPIQMQLRRCADIAAFGVVRARGTRVSLAGYSSTIIA